MSATPAAKRAVAESCIDYLTLELVNTYRKQLQGPPLQVNSTRPPPPPEHAWAAAGFGVFAVRLPLAVLHLPLAVSAALTPDVL